MIYNSDFVTNSSSTSFVLFVKGDKVPSLMDFYKAVKVDEDSPLATIYKQLYNLIIENMEEAQEISFKEINSNNYRFFDEFSAEGEEEIKRRIEEGEKAFIGTISDDSAVGGYFMGKKIVIIGDSFYFNWESDAY